MYMDPLVSSEHIFEIVTQAIGTILLKHVMATCDLGKGLRARLEGLCFHRRDDT